MPASASASFSACRQAVLCFAPLGLSVPLSRTAATPGCQTAVPYRSSVQVCCTEEDPTRTCVRTTWGNGHPCASGSFYFLSSFVPVAVLASLFSSGSPLPSTNRCPPDRGGPRVAASPRRTLPFEPPAGPWHCDANPQTAQSKAIAPSNLRLAMCVAFLGLD